MNSNAERSEATPQRSYWIHWLSFAFIAGGGTTLDLLTKQWVFSWRGLPGQQPPYWVVDGYVGIETAVNPGALFGMGEGYGLVFAGLSIVAAVAVLIWLSLYRAIESRWLLIALGCVMAGVFGNFYDRLGLWNPPPEIEAWSSGVRDWILFQVNDQWKWPNFNIADSLLVCGAFMLAYHSLFLTPPEEEKATQEA